MANTLPRVQYWTKWRTVMEIIKFILFLGIEVIVIYIILLELLYVFQGNGLPFSLPSDTPTFRF